MLKFGLFKSHLTSVPNDHVAVIQKLEMVDEEDILKEIVAPGGVTATQAQAVLTAWYEAIENTLKDGKGVKTKFIEIRPAIKGVFEGSDAKFDPTKHYVVFNVLVRDYIREIAKLLKVQKVRVGERAPMIRKFVDTVSKRHDGVISNGKVGELSGKFLKCDPNDQEQGVFLIHPDGSAIHISTFIHNTGNKLIFFLPENLIVGDEVVLEVRNKLNNHVKEVRVCRYPQVLKVI
jgi:hypothetical protein